MNGCSFIHHALVLATVANSRDAIRKLVELGADPNVQLFSSYALSFACQSGNSDIASNLIASGADVDAMDPLGDRLIYTAIKNDQPVVIQVLIDRGCDVTSPSGGRFGMTPFQLASYICRPKILSMLHGLVSNIDQKALYHLSPLHFALMDPILSVTHQDGSVSTCNLKKINPQQQIETVYFLF